MLSSALRRRSTGAGLFLLVVMGAGVEGEAADPLPNVVCPVQPGEAAVSEHSVVHQGRRVYLCCEACVTKFRKNPSAYLPNLRTAGPSAAPRGPRLSSYLEPGEPSSRWLALRSLLESQGRALGVAAVLLLLAGLNALRARSSRRPLPPPLRYVRSPGWALGAVLVGVGHQQIEVHRALEAQSDRLARVLEMETVHFTTFVDNGFPPRPRRLPGPPRLGRTYYRGNDERSPTLFNNGQYRTSTFRLSLRTDEKPEVAYGDTLAGKRPGVRLHIERAPLTADFFWEPSHMARAYLTRESHPFMGSKSPVPDRVGLREIEPRQRWEAVYPLEVPARGRHVLTGTVYVCEERHSDLGIIGGRFHFAIEYALIFENGVVLPESDLWMGFLYRGRTFAAHRVRDEDWFSEQPIRVKSKVDHADAAALGIPEAKGQGASGGLETP